MENRVHFSYASTFLGSKSKPSRTKGPEKVSMSEQRHVALHRTHLFDDTIVRRTRVPSV